MARKTTAAREAADELPLGACRGLTKKGTPCKQSARPGEAFCRYHVDQAAEYAEQALDDETLASFEPDADEGSDWDEEVTGEQELPPREAEKLYKGLWQRLNAFLKSFPGVQSEVLSEGRALYDALWARMADLQSFQRARIQTALKELLESDLLDRDFWEGLWFVLRMSLEQKLDSFGRHWRGEQEIDEFGMDEEFLDTLRPVFNFFYKVWWRVSAHGVENVPDDGRTLMAVNHSGVLPFDAAMVMMAIWNEHDCPRPVRTLHLSWFASIPFLAPLLARTGQVTANPENARALLERDQLVSVFPEGIKGVGKMYKDRYQLARFGRGGFIRTAMATMSPIVPVAVVGAEEIYPVMARLDWLGKPLGMPFLPVTPTFPFLGLFGLVPLPSKWSIDFCKPIKFQDSAREMVDDYLVVSLLTEMIRKEIQETIYRRLKRRRSIWY